MGMNPPPSRPRWTVRREPGFDPRVIAPGLTLGDPLASKPRRHEEPDATPISGPAGAPAPTHAPQGYGAFDPRSAYGLNAYDPTGQASQGGRGSQGGHGGQMNAPASSPNDLAPLELTALAAAPVDPVAGLNASTPAFAQPFTPDQDPFDAPGVDARAAGPRAAAAPIVGRQDAADSVAADSFAADSFAADSLSADSGATASTGAEPVGNGAPAPAASPRRPTPNPEMLRALRRRRPRNRLLWGVAGLALTLTAAAGALVLVGPQFGLHLGPPPVSDDAEHAAAPAPGVGGGSLFGRFSTKAGLAVADVLVEGRERTPMSAVASALAVQRGDPILSFDAEAARQRLMAVSWIERATVERRLPNLVYVRLEERTPLALWQREGRFAVVDAKGVVVVDGEVGPYAALPQVIGEGANVAAEELLIMLDAEPALKARVAAATRVGKRRWTLRMDNGVDVLLPEDAPDFAYGQLAELQRDKQVLERDVVSIDLRQSDRMILRLSKEASDKIRPVAPAAAPKRNG